MVSKGDHIVVLWPEYFDAKRSRSKGRRVPRDVAVIDPTAEEINKAAGSLGINPILEEDYSYPSAWWKKSGRVLIRKSKPKTTLLSIVAKRMTYNRKNAPKSKASGSDRKSKKKGKKGRKKR